MRLYTNVGLWDWIASITMKKNKNLYRWVNVYIHVNMCIGIFMNIIIFSSDYRLKDIHVYIYIYIYIYIKQQKYRGVDQKRTIILAFFSVYITI
jgi:hypothetical protein